MTKQQKEFILNKLIPFIMREQGRGFGMSVWALAETPGNPACCDDIDRDVPACGTIACIGGSCQVLVEGHYELLHYDPRRIARIIGVTASEARGLCFRWSLQGWDPTCQYGWPRRYVLAYHKARTCLAKAHVACRLLRRIARDGNGKCLHRRPAKNSTK